MSETGTDGRNLIFVSYSRADTAWAQRFEVMLKPVIHRERLAMWLDMSIQAGDRWLPEIEVAITRSRIALLLVSADFLASPFIMNHELPALLRHGVRLAPVLVGDCYWQEIPALATVQWLHDPHRDGPLNLAAADRSGQRDRRIRQACDNLLGAVPGRPPASTLNPVLPRATMSVPIAEISASTTSGALSEVPGLPHGYVPREELSQLVE